jgi:4-amino-4-deoxy-L-arabinose transferase-like glycosyltransferase
LVALMAASLLLGLAWAFVTPPFQGPDENAHVGYVQSLVEGPGLPGDAMRPPLSTEQVQAMDASNADQTAAVLETKPSWDRAADAAWRAGEKRLTDAQRGDGGGPIAAAGNPPLYYALEAGAYEAPGGSFFGRLLAMRLLTLLWLPLTVLAAWLLAGEVLGRDRLLQLAAASIAALAPMSTFVAGFVGPDAMLYALWTAAAWLGVRLIKRGLDWRGALALGAVVGVGCLVKATSYGLVPVALLALVVSAWRSRSRPRALGAAAAGGAALAVPVGSWLIASRLLDRAAAPQISSAVSTAGTNVRELASYAWQFYLPRLPFMQDFFHMPGLNWPLYDVFVKGAWGRFGWLEVLLPDPVYVLLGVVTLAVAVAAGLVLWRDRRCHDPAVAAFLTATVLVLLAGLHWTDYHLLRTGEGFMQGRYLLPLVGIAGLVLAQSLRLIPAGRQPVAVAVCIAGLFALQLLALGAVLVRFYA